jgi:nucleoside phosphorylase
MHLGPVASGASVVADPSFLEEVKLQHRKLLGVEMEAYGVLAAAEESPLPQPKAFSIKSVCDFGDENKNDQFQHYAAFTSASALKIFVERYLLL